MMTAIMDHTIYNASYNLFAALLAEIENSPAQKCFAANVAHHTE